MGFGIILAISPPYIVTRVLFLRVNWYPLSVARMENGAQLTQYARQFVSMIYNVNVVLKKSVELLGSIFLRGCPCEIKLIL